MPLSRAPLLTLLGPVCATRLSGRFVHLQPRPEVLPSRRHAVHVAAAMLASSSAGRCAAADNAVWQRATPDAPDPENIFARILRGEAPADVVENNQDSDLFVFKDRRPASKVHLLVIPRRFIRDASMLEVSDADLVRRMEVKARELVQQEVGADNFDERELTMGFHWPPWYSVPWLHLHAIYPRSEMSRRYKYTAFSFKPPEYVLRRLGAWP
jgi:diadenosine tetraphosphate (Ap4A) HIT family hydrolase